MTAVVLDSSTVVAALVDQGPTGRWADSVLSGHRLLAPAHLPVEAAAALRRLVRTGAISGDVASLAHDDLLGLRLLLFPYTPFGQRIWQLRDNVTPYDAWYIALAETLDVDLATADGPLSRAPGPHCRFITPPDTSSDTG